MRRWLAAIIVLGIAGGCSPNIQGSTPDEIAASIKRVVRHYPKRTGNGLLKALRIRNGSPGGCGPE
jgi:hypothetical protein